MKGFRQAQQAWDNMEHPDYYRDDEDALDSQEFDPTCEELDDMEELYSRHVSGTLLDAFEALRPERRDER